MLSAVSEALGSSRCSSVCSSAHSDLTSHWLFGGGLIAGVNHYLLYPHNKWEANSWGVLLVFVCFCLDSLCSQVWRTEPPSHYSSTCFRVKTLILVFSISIPKVTQLDFPFEKFILSFCLRLINETSRASTCTAHLQSIHRCLLFQNGVNSLSSTHNLLKLKHKLWHVHRHS